MMGRAVVDFYSYDSFCYDNPTVANVQASLQSHSLPCFALLYVTVLSSKWISHTIIMEYNHLIVSSELNIEFNNRESALKGFVEAVNGVFNLCLVCYLLHDSIPGTRGLYV